MLVLAIITTVIPVFAQRKSLWSDVSESQIRVAQGARTIVPRAYRTLSLNQAALKNISKSFPMESNVPLRNSNSIISLPMPDGSFQNFRVVESPVMEPGLMKKYPEIKTYLG